MKYRQLTGLSGGGFYALDEHCAVTHIYVKQPDILKPFEFEHGYDYEFEDMHGVLVYTKTKKEKPSMPSARRVHSESSAYYFVEDGFDSRTGVVTSPIVKDIVVVRNLPLASKDAIIIIDICNQTHDLYYVHNAIMGIHLASKESLEDYSDTGVIAFVSELNDLLYHLQHNNDFDSVPESLEVTVTFNYIGQPVIKFLGLTLYDPDCGLPIQEFGYDQIKANLNEITALLGKFKCA